MGCMALSVRGFRGKKVADVVGANGLLPVSPRWFTWFRWVHWLPKKKKNLQRKEGQIRIASDARALHSEAKTGREGTMLKMVG